MDDAETGPSQTTLLSAGPQNESNLEEKQESEEWTAKLCIVMIGIGYLFPIAAVWASFDYWKLLFPNENVEFPVTLVYQVGSIATVLILSFIESFNFNARILGGFSGQFLCLAAIFSFRWLPIASSMLYKMLLLLVFLCSVATGALDSALLSLCAQYSSTMQGYLQVGLGFGTLVSVLYRDGTKLLINNDVADATCAFFIIALVTVLLCVSAYLRLMTLPISQHLTGASKNESGRRSASYGSLELADKVDNRLSSVFRKVWFNQLIILINLLLTTACYPGLITTIPCRQMSVLSSDEWFQTILLTVFTLADIVARFLTHIRVGLNYRNIYWTAIVRVLLLPLMIYCAVSKTGHDLLSMLAVAVFGFLNGYCVSLSLIVVIEIPDLSQEQRKTCGRISACSVNTGLCLGAFSAAALSSALKLC